MTRCISSIIVCVVLLFVNGISYAQSKQKQVEKVFEGLWVEKKTTRCLEISFGNGYATIIDWTSKVQKRESGDIYRAFLKNGKLIMPEDTEHRAPYSEIRFKNNKLIYLTRDIGMGRKPGWDTEVFTRKKL